MPISSIQAFRNNFSNIVYSNPLANLPTNKYIDFSDPNDDEYFSYDELVLLSNPKTSTQYLIDNSIKDYTKDIKAGNIPHNLPNLPIKQLVIYSNPLTTSYEINKMAYNGKIQQDEADRINQTILKNSIGYALNLL